MTKNKNGGLPLYIVKIMKINNIDLTQQFSLRFSPITVINR